MLKATNLAFKIDAMSDIVVMSCLATCAAPYFLKVRVNQMGGGGTGTPNNTES